MANTLRFKRGLVSGIPTAALGEPLFTTDTFDLYIGNGTGNTRFQKYIASGTTSQLLRGDGSLLTMPIVLTSPSTGQVLKYNGTSWVNDSDAGITGSGASGQVAYFTGATTQSGSNNLFWDATNNRLGIGVSSPLAPLQIGNGYTAAGYTGFRNTNSPAFLIASESTDTFHRILGGTYNTASTINVDLALPLTKNLATAGTGFRITSGVGTGITTVNGYLAFSSLTGELAGTFTATERMRLVASTGNLLIGSTTDNGLRFQVTGDGYFSGSVGIGTSGVTSASLTLQKVLSGTNLIGIYNLGQIQSTNGNSSYYQSEASTSATAITVTNLRHFFATTSSFGAGSAVTNQFGFAVQSSMVGATNNYGFFGDIASGTGRWNLYMNGTADNYLAGNLGLGVTTPLATLQIGNGYTVAGYTGFRNTNSPAFLIASASTDTFHRILGGNYNTASTINVDLALPLTKNLATAGTGFRITSGVGTGITTVNGYLAFSSLTGEVAGTFTATERMRLDASGNLGLGVTPSVWSSQFRAMHFLGNGASISGRTDVAAINVNSNWYWDGSNSRYIVNGFASTYRQYLGAHEWSTAPSGTAGNAITFTQAMTLFATGNLAVGTTTDAGYRLDVNGTMRVSGASTFNSDMTLSLNQNATTSFTVSNTTNNTDAGALIKATVGTGGNEEMQLGKFSLSRTAFKIINSRDGFIFNNSADISILNNAATGSIKMAAGGSSTAHFTIASTGAATFSSNVGINVTPSAWGSTSRALQIGTTTGLENWTGSTVLENNGFRNSAGDYKYLTTSFATSYAQTSNGRHEWYLAPSGTAGATITFFQAMTLDVSGNLGLGTTAPKARLHTLINGNASIGITGTTLIGQNSSSGNSSYLTLVGAFDADAGIVFTDESVGYRGRIVYSNNNEFMSFWTDLSERMRIHATGNLSIGTTTDAGFKLDVNGTMRVSGASTFGANLTVDTDTFHVDSSTNRVGIGTVSATGKLHVNGSLGSFRVLDSGAEVYFSRDNNNDIYANGGSSAAISIGAQSHVRFLTGTTLTEIGRFTTNAFQFSDGINIVLNATTGTKIGTATSQKLSFWNAAPIVQPTTAVASATRVGGAGNTITDTDTFDGYTMAQVVKALRNAGLLA